MKSWFYVLHRSKLKAINMILGTIRRNITDHITKTLLSHLQVTCLNIYQKSGPFLDGALHEIYLFYNKLKDFKIHFDQLSWLRIHIYSTSILFIIYSLFSPKNKTKQKFSSSVCLLIIPFLISCSKNLRLYWLFI